MNTETREIFRGWVCYDADCPFCHRWALRSLEPLARRGWHLAPLQAGWIRQNLGLNDGEVPDEMKLLTADGGILGGADALIHLAHFIWWAWPLYAMAQMPGARPILRAAYRRVAMNRHCLGRRCAIPAKTENRHHRLARAFYDLP